jgi:hypothetical protein
MRRKNGGLLSRCLLTPTSGDLPYDIGDHLEKADVVTKAFGAVLGKALGSIKEGLGMIPVLVTLQ